MSALSPAARRLLRRERAGQAVSLSDALAVCKFRSLLGTGLDADNMLSRLGAAIVLIDTEYEPLSPDVLASAIDALGRGQTVLIAATHSDVRDCAKRAVTLAAAWCGGNA
jgi:hypothetical protein